MIDIDTEKKIRKLLSEGVMFKDIAERLHVGRKLIGKINKLPEIRDRKGAQGKRIIRRCPTCGGKVFLWPCLLCNPQVGCY